MVTVFVKSPTSQAPPSLNSANTLQVVQESDDGSSSISPSKEAREKHLRLIPLLSDFLLVPADLCEHVESRLDNRIPQSRRQSHSILNKRAHCASSLETCLILSDVLQHVGGGHSAHSQLLLASAQERCYHHRSDPLLSKLHLLLVRQLLHFLSSSFLHLGIGFFTSVDDRLFLNRRAAHTSIMDLFPIRSPLPCSIRFEAFDCLLGHISVDDVLRDLADGCLHRLRRQRRNFGLHPSDQPVSHEPRRLLLFGVVVSWFSILAQAHVSCTIGHAGHEILVTTPQF
mmetsp:Transcript_108423/g.171084  ORF Transcript_108423/g.171084 Transcript_108423/m.171084 type:complete len:285 (+) Transcript_108423:754-1608(+)